MMETNKSIGGRPRDSFVDPHVVPVEDHEGNIIAKKCIYCDHRFSTKTSVTRIKAHLGGVPSHDVALCKKVPSAVKETARNAMLRSSARSRPNRMMQVGPSTPNIHVSHSHTQQPRSHQKSEFCPSTPHQPQHTLTAIQEMSRWLLSSPQDGENHFEHDMLTEVQQEEMPLCTAQPSESCSMHNLASQCPMQQHLGEDPNCLPDQPVQQDATRMDSMHDAIVTQDFLQEKAHVNILPHSSHQEDMIASEFDDHEGPDPRHHVQDNLRGDQGSSSLDHYPYPSIEPQLHHGYIDPLLESLNAPTWTSKQAQHEKKRKLPNKSPPVGRRLPLATTFQGLTFNKKVDEIRASLEDDFVSRIGVYGMGGSGKTTIMKHIYNLLLEEHLMPFSHVIWVTVSQDYTIAKLQRHLAGPFNVILSHDEDEVARAASLYEAMRNKCYALILDDVWGKINLEEVGIPEPSRDNGCKLILTTRSLDVCTRMQCQPIFLDLLLEEEAWDFFVKTLAVTPKNSIVEGIMKEVAKECACLPLAIVTVAGSMRGILDIHEWRNALNSLKRRTYAFTGVEKEVIGKLKFSYHRLSKQLQQCLVVCALYPEDYRIKKEELIHLLISEGTIESTESLLSAYDHGYTILNKLENVCLLTRDFTDAANEVMMHDLVRDMCLDIVGGCFLVKCHSMFFPDESNYSKDVEKISLIGSEFEEIPSHLVSCCPQLSTLLLSNNKKLIRISDSFFMGLPCLKVLNLSRTSIRELPNSVTNLVSLNALVLQKCLQLKCLPCLAPLKELKRLDLFQSGIEQAPEGLGELVSLIYLDLNETKIMTLPRLILRNLVKLQVLQIGWIEITTDDVNELKNLETFQATFVRLEEFNEYVSSLLKSKRGPAIYEVRFSCGLMSFGIHRDVKGTIRLSVLRTKDERGNKINYTELMFPQDVEIIIPSPELVEFLYIGNLGGNCNFFSKLKRVASSPLHMLPICLLHKEKTKEIGQSKGLFDAKLFHTLSNLKGLAVWHCLFMEELISTSSSTGVLNFSLEGILISECNKLVSMLNPKLLSCFSNLQWIRIDECMSLESIISAANPKEKGESDNVICFPKLRHLILADLPNLRSICDGICPSIETIHVRRCPKLRRLPLQLPVLDHNSGRLLFPLSSLALICGEPTWWASLKWDHPHSKTLLRPYFKPCLHCYADDDLHSARRFNKPFYS